jgi:hypothetical protein
MGRYLGSSFSYIVSFPIFSQFEDLILGEINL